MDRTANDSGIVGWKNRVMSRRLRLVEYGLLKDDSPRGLWEVSDAGRDALAAARAVRPGRPLRSASADQSRNALVIPA